MESSKKNQYNSKKALLIEDNLACQKIMTYYLSQLTFHVDLSHDYYDAVRNIKRKVYDLIIGDINLHGKMLGQSITQVIHESKLNTATPIIVWSAYINKNDEKKYLEGGANAALIKTCGITGLKNAIYKCSLTLDHEKILL